jgi:hypothetical protein
MTSTSSTQRDGNSGKSTDGRASSMNNSLVHAFDVEVSQNESLDLFAEELPEQVQLLQDCFSSGSSISSSGGCVGSFSTMSSVISCG